MRRKAPLGGAALLAGTLLLALGASPAQAKSCADYPNQAAAQRAADTRDADGDGIYCESLPCPCLKKAGGNSGGGNSGSSPQGCIRPRGVQSIGFSSTKYPNIFRHFSRAVKAGWPKVLKVNRSGADARRDRLLANVFTRSGFDRDEYPPAMGRGRGKGLTRGTNPTGWMASVQYVPSSENRSHGSVLGTKLRRFCNGTLFRYVFY
jgi:hypothetical protein